ncbi:hypothetical protein RD792_009910 [Penstemon davidsonii]|uniref:Protein kinase domain-containing protein n=1 Tax=Penstemon davidsonii TaxID=160366 RepID=A0ABR0D1T4_9LAMI|nr:hypothetical protein RD792_009910 [Penstemon davidsonii]
MHIVLVVLFIYLLGAGVNGTTDPNDFKILNDFKNGLENSDLLKWPYKGNDPCGPPAWPHVFCSNGRVTQIQVQGLGLKGPLPQNFNQLDKLQNLGFQRNQFNGHLPSFSGLSNLQFAYLDFNNFDTIPSDFFHGLSSVRVLALDKNPFNQSSGWTIPSELADSSQLVNFSCSDCNIVGPIPDFFGKFSSLSSLRLSYNKLNGKLPSTFRDSMLQVLWLNDQDGGGMSGPIDVIGTMVGLAQVRLHGNQFTGSIPDNIGDLTSLKEFNVNGNHLVGLIPQGLANLDLNLLDLNNNMFMGPIPNFKASNVSYNMNSFCQSKPGDQCAPEVSALLDFLHDLYYPQRLDSSWTGNDPCQGPWWGITCDSRGHVSIVNLQRLGLNGTLSPSLVNLPGLREIHLEGNSLHGTLPTNLTELRFLRTINLSGNDFEPPLPRFRNGVRVVTDYNPRLVDRGGGGGRGRRIQSKHPSPNGAPDTPDDPPYDLPPVPHSPPSDGEVIGAATGSVVIIGLAILLAVFFLRKKRKTKRASSVVVVHPKDSSKHGNKVKIAVVDNSSASEAENGSGALDNGNMVISLQVLQKVTNNFAKENELGRGGFGVVYKGELEDGTKLAVKRMESGAIGNKALDEFNRKLLYFRRFDTVIL